jgi:hypothetical protein
MHFARSICLWVLASVTLGGCGSSYHAPGRAADMSQFGGLPPIGASHIDPKVIEARRVPPSTTLPATLAIVRVQESGYRSRSLQSYGNGAYSVVTQRGVETDDDVLTIRRWPGIRDVTAVNRLLLPRQLDSSLELRRAAAALGAELLLLYTFDTTIRHDDHAAPVSVLTLGLFPTTTTRAQTTASAVILDVGTGYVYGVAEASSRKSELNNEWTDEEAAESTCRRAERDALNQLIPSLEQAWRTGSYAARPSHPTGAYQHHAHRREPRATLPEGSVYLTR